jgi:predicted Zn-dependent protease
LLALAPDNAIVLNNLAEVMLDRGCAAPALTYADAALERVPAGGDVEAAVRDTRAQAAAALVEDPDSRRCSVD